MCGNGAIGANVEGRADQVAPRRSVPRRCRGKRSIMLSARRGCGNHLRLPAGAPRGVTGCNCPAPTTRGPLKVARRAWQLCDNDTGSPGEGDEGARMSTDKEGRQSEEGTPPPGVSHTERCGSQCCGAVSSGSMRASRTGQSKVRNRPAFFGSSWALRRLPDIRHGCVGPPSRQTIATTAVLPSSSPPAPSLAQRVGAPRWRSHQHAALPCVAARAS